MTNIAQNGYAHPADYQQKLGAAIIEGVGKLGEHAAEEIDKIAAKLEGDAEARAAQLVSLAKEGADKLRGFANAMRERHREEAESASKFCDTVKLLHERFEGVEQQLYASKKDDMSQEYLGIHEVAAHGIDGQCCDDTHYRTAI